MTTKIGWSAGSIFAAVLVCIAAESAANGASIAIVQGDFYTPDLKNVLVANGQTVTEITTYTAATLAPFNAVIQYGNDSLDQAALAAYATAGGRVIETPWFWNNNSPIASLDIFSHGGGTSYTESYPGVNVLNAANPLLAGVTFPPGTGGVNIGRTTGNTFTPGVTQVANWLDGTAFIGSKALGSGMVIGINMHVITSDTAYQVINEPWAQRLFLNAVGVVPEPTSAMLLIGGVVGLVGYRKRRLG
jgi:PEP-CTERM motif-containing protein